MNELTTFPQIKKMSKLIALVVGAAILVSATGGWKKLLSPRNVQSAAKTLRETKEIFVNELKGPTTQVGQHAEAAPKTSTVEFTKPTTSEPLSSITPDQSTTSTTTEKKE